MMQPDRDLERELRELGPHVEYPPTPDLARAVRRRLDEEGQQARPRTLWTSLPSFRWAAVAAAFLLVVAIPALSPAMRATVAGWFEGGAARAPSTEQAAKGESRAQSARSDSGGSSIGPLAPSAGGPRSLGEELGFGERIPLREARTRVVAGKLLLAEMPKLGEPDEVYVGKPPNEEGVTLVYGARPGLPSLGDTGIGLVLTELPGEIEAVYLPGGERPEAGLERVQIGGTPGYWVPAGRGVPSPIGRTERLRGSVLLWEQGGLALRLQANVSKQKAIRVAESMR